MRYALLDVLKVLLRVEVQHKPAGVTGAIVLGAGVLTIGAGVLAFGAGVFSVGAGVLFVGASVGASVFSVGARVLQCAQHCLPLFPTLVHDV